jgi:translation elongation factor EF-Ts
MVKDIQIDESPREISVMITPVRDGLQGMLITYETETGAHMSIRLHDLIPGNFVTYMYHRNNRVAIIKFEGPVDSEKAMPVAVQYMSADGPEIDCPAELYGLYLKAEKEEAMISGKPEAIAEKIAIGKVAAKLKGSCLLYQPMYNDAKCTVKQYMEKHGLPNIKKAYLIKS